MAQAITAGKISKDYVKFAPDSIFDGSALPNAGDLTSAEFMIGYDQGGVAVRVEADSTVNIDGTETLDLYLITYASSGGAEVETFPFGSITGATVFEIDGLIGEYIAGNVGPWARLKLTTSGDESGDTINAYLRRVPS
jgi:hypothetical protein